MPLEQTPDGLWRMRYYADGTKKGRRVQETLPKGTTWAKANRIYKQRVARAANREAGLGVSLTFEEAGVEYLSLHGPKMSEAGRERAESILTEHLNPAFGAIKLENLTRAEVERYQNDRTSGKKPASPATVNRELGVFRAVLNKAETWGYLERNPIRRGGIAPLDAPNGKTRFFSAEEWDGFITAFDSESHWKEHFSKVRRLGPVRVGALSPEPRVYGGGLRPDSDAGKDYLERLRAAVPVFKALLYTGSRLSEILALRWGDVDLERNQVAIHQQKTRKGKHVPMSVAFRAVIDALPKGTPAAFVFVRSDRLPFAKIDIQRAFAVARRMVDLPDELTVHTLRHTFASWLAIQGTPLRTIAELLGHSDIRMTWRYSHLSPSHLREAVEAVGAVEKSLGRHSGATSTADRAAS